MEDIIYDEYIRMVLLWSSSSASPVLRKGAEEPQNKDNHEKECTAPTYPDQYLPEWDTSITFAASTGTPRNRHCLYDLVTTNKKPKQ